MNKIEIVNKIDNKIFDYIVKIGDDNFANGYFTKEYLMAYLDDSNSFVLVQREERATVNVTRTFIKKENKWE